MKTLTTLAAGAAVLLMLAGPTLAKSRSHVDRSDSQIDTSDVNTVKTYGDQDLNNPPNRSGFSSFARSQPGWQGGSSQGGNWQSGWQDKDNSGHYRNYTPGQNLPYADRPYGDPDVD